VNATDILIDEEVFRFTGQSSIDTWSLRDHLVSSSSRYSRWLVADIHLTMQRIKELADSFPFWQRRKSTGRRPVSERDLMIAFLVRQLFNATFRQLQALLELLQEYFALDRVPHHTVLSRKNRSARWTTIWQRFHDFVVASLPQRSVIVATDATGFSGRKRPWREVDHGLKATQDWVKTHAAIEVDSFMVLSYSLTSSNVHESQMFAEVWDHLPKNVSPKRSLADSAYHGEICLAAARQHGATPLHGIKRNARHFARPQTNYQKMVSFWQHWPTRAAALYGKRNHAETAFSMIGGRFGHRIRCRSEVGRKNEVRTKIASRNIRMLAWLSFKSAD